MLGATMLLPAAAQAYSAWPNSMATTKASIDLNGDGKKDKISLQNIAGKGSRKYKLIVNGKPLYDHIASGMGDPKFIIANINRKSRYKEIVVSTEGVDHGLTNKNIYWYNGRNIRRVGSFGESWTDYIGNGTVKFTDFRIFWDCHRTFKLNTQHRLIETSKQPGVELAASSDEELFKIKRPLALRKRPRKTGNVALLSVGMKVEVTKADLKEYISNGGQYRSDNWFYVKAGNGKSGWMREDETLSHIAGVSAHN